MPKAAPDPPPPLSALGAIASSLAALLTRMLPEGDPHAGAVPVLTKFAASAPEIGQPLARLAAAFDLAQGERDLILLAGLPEEHEIIAGLFRVIHPRGEPRPTVGLAAQLLCRDQKERALLRETLGRGAATRAGALEAAGDGPFFERNLVLAEALWPVLLGIDAWPAAIPRIEGPVATVGLDEWLAEPPVARARAALQAGAPRTVLVLADTETLALERGAALAAAAGVPFVRIAPPAVSFGAPLERLIGLHALARGAVPIVRVAPAEGQAAAALPAFDAHPGPVVLCVRAGMGAIRGSRPVIAVHAGGLSRAARSAMWAASLPALASSAGVLAARYPLEPQVAAEIAHDVTDLTALEARQPSMDDVANSVRTRAAVALSVGVALVRPAATWNDLVLPNDRLTQLQEAVNRLHLQARVLEDWGFLASRPGARGVRTLFAGPPGTGKTLSAEVMAAALGMDLLVVDISRVVSKWIGETEKNLASVFDAAERGRAVLFFDEADALFGKRTEVSDAHDRYANLETAYLLARLERFEGLVVLSTNLRQNIDGAFIRRLEFVVEFEEPDAAARELLWQRHVPKSAPLDGDVDLGDLAACYAISGGLIRNASVAAGFLAAAAGTSIGRGHFVHAIRREYEKAGRAFPGALAGMSNQQGGRVL